MMNPHEGNKINFYYTPAIYLVFVYRMLVLGNCSNIGGRSLPKWIVFHRKIDTYCIPVRLLNYECEEVGQVDVGMRVRRYEWFRGFGSCYFGKFGS